MGGWCSTRPPRSCSIGITSCSPGTSRQSLPPIILIDVPATVLEEPGRLGVLAHLVFGAGPEDETGPNDILSGASSRWIFASYADELSAKRSRDRHDLESP